MNTKEQMVLMKKNTVEIIEESELEELVRSKKTPRVYCGYETSGPVHIGTAVTVQKLMDFQKAGFEVVVLLADVHTLLNRKGSEEWIRGMTEYWKHCFIAWGLDENKTEFVLGSDFQFRKEYVTDILDLSLKITVNRATRTMTDIARDLEHAHVSQIIYPIMQALDIKHLNIDVACAGLEQRRIHMMARETLEELGFKKPICVHTPLLVSLQGPESKMSSSKPETVITIHEDSKSIEKKIMDAYCPPKEAEGNPVLQIFEYLIFSKLNEIVIERDKKYGGALKFDSYKELEKAYKEGLHPLDLKKACAKYLNEVLASVREYFKDKGDVLNRLNK